MRRTYWQKYNGFFSEMMFVNVKDSLIPEFSDDEEMSSNVPKYPHRIKFEPKLKTKLDKVNHVR